MTSNDGKEEQTKIWETINRLRNTIEELPELLSLLTAPLETFKLLPPQYSHYNTEPLPAGSVKVPKHIPPLQRALLEHIIPTWEAPLKEKRLYGLVEQYFCPDAFAFTSSVAGELAIHAYSTILSLPLVEYSTYFLVRLSKAYPIDVAWTVIFGGSSGASGRWELTWEDLVRDISAIPAKVANALGPKSAIPLELEQGTYFNHVSRRCEILVKNLSAKRTRGDIFSVTYLLTKLVNLGIFPATVPSSTSQPSFFKTNLDSIRYHLNDPSYGSFWNEIFVSVASTITLRAIITSLFVHLNPVEGTENAVATRILVKKEGLLLRSLLGKLSTDRDDLWDAVNAVILGRDWDEGYARIFICWIAGSESRLTEVDALELFLSNIVDLWTNPDHIRHSLLKKHQYVTALLLLSISYLNAPSGSSAALVSLAFSPQFIKSISTYLTHLDPSVRRCGMLVAEEVARASGKMLDFGDWDGDNDGRAWCRSIRILVEERDTDIEFTEDSDDEAEDVQNEVMEPPLSDSEVEGVPAPNQEGYDSDDSLTGYVSSPSSSRSPSPTPSELEEIEKDPTLRVTQKKIPRPVYLAQLGEMIRPTTVKKGEEEELKAQTQEVGLDTAEELIRRKRSYGTELEENAVNLAYGLAGLQNDYDLDDFVQKRQNALNALVVCCPRKAAPAIIEEFFKNQYSTEQRYVILNALALGARELASLSIPETPALQTPLRLSFASKRLPQTLHNRYLTTADQQSTAPVQHLLEGISQDAIDKSRDSTTDKVPQYAREKQLRVSKPAKVTEVKNEGSLARLQSTSMTVRPTTVFTDVAAESFICPLINRFWLFLRDEQTREARTANQPVLHQYKGAGTGLILNALVLSHFMATLAVLVHAGRNAKEWLAIIAPDALELAVTVGTRPLSSAEGEDEDMDESIPGSQASAKGKEAAVLTTSLELALVVLDGCLYLDGGRTISLEHTSLVLGVNQWAEGVLSTLEKGMKILGGGGVQEIKLRRAAAGVILKAEEVTSKWRRSMIDTLPNSSM
ncbi:hypothetical protein QCA50_002752 [Cerrena zonata]|uniref:Telomere length regulation protein conserved domain-containing protein n=1 Tax=Cerrena zonata TaxID=2478898 RepID=A0AAW0GIL7_9APHY